MRMRHFTEVHFASLLSGGFITAIVVNLLDRKPAERTSVHQGVPYLRVRYDVCTIKTLGLFFVPSTAQHRYVGIFFAQINILKPKRTIQHKTMACRAWQKIMPQPKILITHEAYLSATQPRDFIFLTFTINPLKSFILSFQGCHFSLQ